MKVALVIPPSSLSQVEVVSTHYPVNLGYIAASLMKKGREVELWDYNVEPFTMESFSTRLRESKPDIIGFGCMTLNIKNGNKLAEVAKQQLKNVFCLVAGAHSTALPVQTLEEFPSYDAVVVGEGEHTIVELCEKMEKKKPLTGTLGICHRVKGKVMLEQQRPLIDNLDEIPNPNRDLGKKEMYVRSHVSRGISRKFLNVLEIIVSRGCPYECIFCASHLAYKRRTRYRSLDNVFGEIKECIQKYGSNHVTILDDTFTLNKPLVKEFCSRIKELNITWNCDTRVDQVDQEMLNMMKDSGLIKISFGIEAGSRRVMELIKKQITPEQVIEAFRMARHAKIKFVEGTFMIGSHIDETEEDVNESIRLIRKIKPDLISLAIVTPLPGTYTYEIMKQKGYIFAKEWDKFMYVSGVPTWRTTHFTPEDLVRLQRKVLMSFYLSPHYILRMMKKIGSMNEFRYWFDIGREFFKRIVFSSNPESEALTH